MKLNHLLLILLLALSSAAITQPIQLRAGSFQPRLNIQNETIDSFNRSAKRFSEQTFAVLQFDRIPSAGEQKTLS